MRAGLVIISDILGYGDSDFLLRLWDRESRHLGLELSEKALDRGVVPAVASAGHGLG